MLANGKSVWLAVICWALLCVLLVPAPGSAAGDIGIAVSDPDHETGSDGESYIGNTVNSILFVPTVTYGDNKVMGTLRITGRDDVDVPVQPGNKIKITLPFGTCYMRVPTADTLSHYVEWPETLDEATNQIRDLDGTPGILFVEATARSLTVEIGNVDPEGEMMLLDFVFNRDNESTVRVSRLIDLKQTYAEDLEGQVTRLEFFKSLADLTVPFLSSPLEIVENELSLTERFSDVADVATADLNKIKPLVDAGIITGYQGLLKPDAYITRAEAGHLVGNLYPLSEQGHYFNDDLPEWATGLNAALVKNLIGEYPDGTFQPEQWISKAEVLELLQKTLESYAAIK